MPPPRPSACPALLLACATLLAIPGLARAEDAVERGRDLLVQYRCGSCHTIPGVPGSRGQVAQPLDGWRHRVYIAGRLPNRPDVLERWIVAPQSLVPGTWMPSMGVSPDHARDMARYLYTLE
jgi:cytochrome c